MGLTLHLSVLHVFFTSTNSRSLKTKRRLTVTDVRAQKLQNVLLITAARLPVSDSLLSWGKSTECGLIWFGKSRLHAESWGRNYTENNMIWNNEMCFDLIQKHLREKKNKKKNRYLLRAGIKRHQKNTSDSAPTYQWLLLSPSDYLLILCASKIGQTQQILFNGIKWVFCQGIFRANTKWILGTACLHIQPKVEAVSVHRLALGGRGPRETHL